MCFADNGADRNSCFLAFAGVLNLKALRTVVDFGKLPFAILDGATDESSGDPQLIQNWIEPNVNLNVLITGPTRSGIFPVECVVPLRPSSSETDSAAQGLADLSLSDEQAEKEMQMLDSLRLYLGIMREGSYDVSEEMVKVSERTECGKRPTGFLIACFLLS